MGDRNELANRPVCFPSNSRQEIAGRFWRIDKPHPENNPIIARPSKKSGKAREHPLQILRRLSPNSMQIERNSLLEDIVRRVLSRQGEASLDVSLEPKEPDQRERIELPFPVASPKGLVQEVPVSGS